MARLRITLLSVLFVCGVALGQGVPSTEKPVTITVPTSSAAPETTTSAPTTSTTTVAPKTTTTPAPDTTTSTTTTTTTPVPDTTTSTTTQAPTPPPTPAPAPKPLPPPKQGTWFYSEKNVTCIVLQFAAQLNVTYSTSVNGTQKFAQALLNVPADAAVVAGSCGNDTQWIQLSWPNTTWANNLTVQFASNVTTQRYALHSLNVTLTPDQHFPNASSNATINLWHASEEWSTPLFTSYRCQVATELKMTEDAGDVASLTVSRLQEEAWRTKHSTEFSAPRDCSSGDVPDAVPIAVGCALGGLVVVVLIAYLVGRRRSAARGYLSM